jgi:orotate phosphoribosyltransferase-like protein|tara:strand:+ start:589 stop:864 length:276 start_codon:yes stop_codon:yes gene_type:complete
MTPWIDGLDRKMMALDLRRRGLTYREIGEVFGVSTSRANQLVATATRKEKAWYRKKYSEIAEDISWIVYGLEKGMEITKEQWRKRNESIHM